MFDIGIFFGSDTGNTKKIAYLIYEKLNKKFKVNILDVSKCKIDDFLICKFLIIGTPTWYYGELQYDWNNFLDYFKKINFDKKIVAFFGCGDQRDYSDYFCNGLRILYDIVVNSNAKIIGYWSNKNYKFNLSKSLLKNNKFIGLILDEDNQSDITINRINKWIEIITLEYKKLSF